MFCIRGRYVQPSGIGWGTKDGGVTHNARMAVLFDTEADAWTYLAGTGLLGSDEEGDYAWVEPWDEAAAMADSARQLEVQDRYRLTGLG